MVSLGNQTKLFLTCCRTRIRYVPHLRNQVGHHAASWRYASPSAIIKMTQGEWISTEEAERFLLEWQMSAHSVPYTPSINRNWSRWDHWIRARSFEFERDSLTSPLRIDQILATWPELEGNAGRRHHIPSGLRLLTPFQSENVQQTDIHIQPCSRCGARRFFSAPLLFRCTRFVINGSVCGKFPICGIATDGDTPELLM